MNSRFKIFLVLIDGVVLASLYYYLNTMVLSKMTGFSDWDRFGIAFILIVVFALSIIGIMKMDC